MILKDLKEKTQHGDLMFPLHVYPINWVKDQYFSNPHWHDEMEIIYIRNGRATFLLNGDTVELQENQALLINGGILHTRYGPNNWGCEYYSIVFNLSMLSSGTFDTCQSKYIEPLFKGQVILPQVLTGHSTWECDVIDELLIIKDCFEAKKWAYELSIKASLLRVFSLILSNYTAPNPSMNKNYNSEQHIEILKKALVYIQNNYTKKIFVKELSSYVNLSHYHFSRLFKKITGKTLVDYINCYRIDQSLRLLQDKNMKIINIALEVGFNNESYFIEVFKQIKGCTPMEYRSVIV